MYCRKCGTKNDDNAFKCVACGEILQQIQQVGAPVPSVPTYLAQAILVTLFCCQPFGIVSIVYAAQVNCKLTSGDYAGAVEMSNKARIWCWLSFGIGFVVVGIWFFFVIIGVLSEM